jgi:toxin ParE1/3/4
MNIPNDALSKDPDLTFTPLATIDIKGTWTDLYEHGEGVAAEFIRSVIKICKTISKNPAIGRDRSDLIVDLLQFPFKNYNIFYFPTESGVEIYRVLHSSRDIIQIFDDAIDDKI